MPRPINRLTARTVQAAAAGYHADGGGLYLLVTDAGTRSWVFRFTRQGRKREMGLGSAQTFTLAEARERAREARKVLAEGLDPIDHRQAMRAPQGRRTWGEAVDDFIAAHRAGWKGEAQAAQWEHSLLAYGPDRALPVADVTTGVVLDRLRGIWTDKTETATRVRGRIERVWAAEKVRGTVSGENPAHWRGHLEHLLPKPSKVARRRHFAAMPYADVPAFVAELRQREARSARALEFLILTAARTEEVNGLRLTEVSGALWTIPAERTKQGRPHTVPLVPRAKALLAGLPDPPFPFSENALLALLQKRMGRACTVHGFRSSFRDWGAEETDTPNEVLEMALGHVIADKTEAAYRRGELLAKRRELMLAWAAFIG